MLKRYLLPLCLMVASPWIQADKLPDSEHVSVSAQAEVAVVPDRATITTTLYRVAPKLDTARQDVEQRASQLLDTLKKLGLAPRQLEAGQVRVTPEYRWENKTRTQVGTRVSRNLVIHVEQLERYVDILGALFNAKVEKLQGVQFSYSKQEEVEQQALAQALRKAKRKAQLMAKELDAELGPIYRVTETLTPRLRPMAMRAEAAMQADKPSYEPGTIKVEAQVETVFHLLTKH